VTSVIGVEGAGRTVSGAGVLADRAVCCVWMEKE